MEKEPEIKEYTLEGIAKRYKGNNLYYDVELIKEVSEGLHIIVGSSQFTAEVDGRLKVVAIDSLHLIKDQVNKILHQLEK